LARPRLDDESLRANLETAAATMPEIASDMLIRSWTGIATLISDHLPIVGEVPRSPGFHVVAGGSGFTLGPTFARLLSQQICTGRSDANLAPFSPGRFEQLSGAGR
jgi:sarcosine oxidase, subunit beta